MIFQKIIYCGFFWDGEQPIISFESGNIVVAGGTAGVDYNVVGNGYSGYISLHNGVVVNHYYGFLSVKIPAYYMLNVVGICGNYDQNKYDDYTTINGTVMPFDEGPGWFGLSESEYYTAVSFIRDDDARTAGSTGPLPNVDICDPVKC